MPAQRKGPDCRKPRSKLNLLSAISALFIARLAWLSAG
jgi:hypothetical protein